MQALIESLDQIFLRAEVVVSVTERHARLLGNRAHRRFLVPTLAKHLQSSFKDQRLGLIAFPVFAVFFLRFAVIVFTCVSPATRLIWYRFCEITETTRFVVGSSSGVASR